MDGIQLFTTLHDSWAQGLLYMKEWDSFVEGKNAVASGARPEGPEGRP